jgi:ribosomal protein RSM22 (predicted rRNA methylase)
MVMSLLRNRVESVVDGIEPADLSKAVSDLIERYRADVPARAPVLGTDVEVAAYIAYRMPATAAAAASVFSELARRSLPTPRSMIDVGGGTGAAAWAAGHVFASLETVTVLDGSGRALEYGARLAAASPPPMGTAMWRPWRAPAALPAADLVVACYLLGELDASVQVPVIDAMAAAGAVVVVIEPGTPAGYRRILAARRRLVDAGFGVVAPCPHSVGCPLVDDWCHFSVRVARSALHRRVKSADLGHEDEKFSYVAVSQGASPAAGRVIRHPRYRKGAVGLEVCRAEGHIEKVTVGRADGAYRAARDVRWGEPWPPGP